MAYRMHREGTIERIRSKASMAATTPSTTSSFSDPQNPILMSGLLALKKTLSTTKKYAILVHPKTTEDVKVIYETVFRVTEGGSGSGGGQQGRRVMPMSNVYDVGVWSIFGQLAKSAVEGTPVFILLQPASTLKPEPPVFIPLTLVKSIQTEVDIRRPGHFGMKLHTGDEYKFLAESSVDYQDWEGWFKECLEEVAKKKEEKRRESVVGGMVGAAPVVRKEVEEKKEMTTKEGLVSEMFGAGVNNDNTKQHQEPPQTVNHISRFVDKIDADNSNSPKRLKTKMLKWRSSVANFLKPTTKNHTQSSTPHSFVDEAPTPPPKPAFSTSEPSLTTAASAYEETDRSRSPGVRNSISMPTLQTNTSTSNPYSLPSPIADEMTKVYESPTFFDYTRYSSVSTEHRDSVTGSSGYGYPTAHPSEHRDSVTYGYPNTQPIHRNSYVGSTYTTSSATPQPAFPASFAEFQQQLQQQYQQTYQHQQQQSYEHQQHQQQWNPYTNPLPPSSPQQPTYTNSPLTASPNPYASLPLDPNRLPTPLPPGSVSGSQRGSFALPDSHFTQSPKPRNPNRDSYIALPDGPFVAHPSQQLHALLTSPVSSSAGAGWYGTPPESPKVGKERFHPVTPGMFVLDRAGSPVGSVSSKKGTKE
ncbi:hypothetical protein HDV05_001491 [Chytridiales sp. JEL 0842]|nr:hypothetical protein HDV05_001491 [Chytridiales sp. JEL 0842]